MRAVEVPDPESAYPVVCLLASAGGLDPMLDFFSAVPQRTGIAFLVLQHHGQEQPRHLPALLARQGAIPFRLAQAGEEVRPDQALVLSAGMTLDWAGDQLRVLLAHPVNTADLPGDALFMSMADALGDRAIGVVLSGTGQDGTAGLRAIRARGGLGLAQDPATASHEGMPRTAVDAGAVDAVLPVDRLFSRVLQEAQLATAQPGTAQEIQAICAILARQTGNDFSHYKIGTLGRRIQRRVLAARAGDITAYRAQLEASPEEVQALEQDLLIGVTRFFRDEPAFDALMTHLDPLIRSGEETPLRIWVPGCASGEEAYSLAIRIREVLDGDQLLRRVQIFGTDIDASAILQAKAGRYTPETLSRLDPGYRDRHFTRDQDAWVVNPAIRAMCSFTLHNLLRDPPFSSLNCISCRNLLIYLEPTLQAKLIPLFHFALKPEGLLFLGSSEGLAANPGLFDALDRTHRIFLRRQVDRPALEFPMGERRRMTLSALPGRRPGTEPTTRSNALNLFEQMLLTYYLPASAILNEQGEILFWAGQIGKYLNPGLGQPSSNIHANTSGPLHWALRRLLAKAQEGAGAVLQTLVQHDGGSAEEQVRITLRPMPGLDREARIYALIIQAEGAGGGQDEPRLQEADQPLLDQMKLELQSARVELQGTAEELGAANEGLQTSNEELQSSNEELQASQEEMRSLNDELNGRNNELQETIQELAEANGDLQNLMNSTNIPTIFLDGRLSISRFTPSATHLFGLIAGDLGRPIRDLVPRFTGMDLPALAREVLASDRLREAQIHLPEADRWFIVRLHPYRISAQPVSGVVVTFFDVTDIRRAQQLALENEARYRNLFENLVSGFAHCRMRFEDDRPVDFQYLYANDAFMTQTGLADPTGQWVSQLLPEARNPEADLFQAYARVARGGAPERLETFSAPVGQWLDITVFSPKRDEFVAIFDVITARKQAEAALAESEERYRSLFEASLAVLLVIDPAGGAILAANASAAAFYGWPRTVLETMRIQDLNLLPGDEVAANMGQAVASEHVAFAFQHRLADGRIRDVEVLSSPIRMGGVPRLYSIVQDVTERKQAEDAVREARTKLDAALASLAEALFISDREGRFIEFNEAFASFHRFPDKHACARTFAEYPDLLDVFLPDGSPAPVAQWAVPRALRGETAVDQEYTLRRKDTGETWTGSYNLAPLRDREGRITGSVVTARDITAQKAAVQALVESEQRFRTVFENSPDAIFIRETGARFLEVNQIAVDRYGYTRDELRRMTPEDLVPPRLVPQVSARVQASLASGAPVEWVHQKKDGTEVPVELVLRSFSLGGVPCILASARDITDRKRAEAEKAELQEQLQQSQKLESLGQLAGGIAHDMNNVLGSIFAVAQLLKPSCSADPDDTECLAVLERAAQRGRDLVKGLVGFARKERSTKAALDLNGLVRSEVALLEHTLFQKYQLVVDLEDGLPAIQGDRGALGAALMNLCVNAVDAMPEGGTLGIRTRRLGPGSIQLLVEDTGHGMPPDVAKRAMEPFFTTKPVGQGTGLGLSMVFNTARDHGGTLAIQSEVGKGTQIRVTLPVAAPAPGPETAGDPLVRVGSALDLLLVDDDELIRSTVPLMLGVLGHRVTPVDGGRAALDHLARGPLPDLVILDLNMPDMTGAETLKQIRARFRELPVLLASGYVGPEVDRLVEADPKTLSIAKPFSFDEIQRKFGEAEALRPAPAAGLPQPPAGVPEAPSRPDRCTAAPATGAARAGSEPPASQEPMAILLIEDNAIDALKIHGLLQKRGVACSLTRIQTRQALDAALQAGGIDLILADYRLTGWDGLEALRRVRAQDPDLPFIFISGEVDEPLFVEAIRGGANDFLFKDRLLRLVPAVERERLARQALRKRRALEAERRLLYQSVQQAQDWVLLTDPQGGIVHVNPMAEALTGYPPGELLGQHVRVLNSDGPDADFDRGMVDSLLVGQTWRGRLTCRRKDGSLWASLAIITPVRDERGTLTGYVGSGRMDD